jgi:hypothetical protein
MLVIVFLIVSGSLVGCGCVNPLETNPNVIPEDNDWWPAWDGSGAVASTMMIIGGFLR